MDTKLMITKILTAQDASVYQNLRLEALQNHPEAFGSSYEEEKDYPIDTIAHRLESQGLYVVGYFDHEKLVGIAALVQESKLKLKHKANIFSVYVLPAKRGQGMGKQLIIEVINQARLLKGIEQLNLAVVTTNEAAKKLYVSLGFVTYGTEKNALKIGEQYFDEDYMVLVL